MASNWEVVFSYVPLVLHVIAVLLHSLGIYLLCHVKTHRNSNQSIIMINLSIAEIFMSIFDFTYNIMKKTKVSDNISEYFYIIQCTSFVIPSFLILTFLALDRFLEVFLNIKYPVYITKKTTLKSIACCWVIGFILGAIMVTLKHVCQTNSLKYVFILLFPVFEGVFLLVAATSYTYIYIKFRNVGNKLKKNVQTRKNNVQFSQRRTKMTKENNVFTKRKFFVPTLIMWTFVLFAIIPDQMHLFFFYVYETGTDVLLNLILTLYVIGFICDACIYILLQNNVKRLLMKKIGFRSNTVGVGNSCNPQVISSS